MVSLDFFNIEPQILESSHALSFIEVALIAAASSALSRDTRPVLILEAAAEARVTGPPMLSGHQASTIGVCGHINDMLLNLVVKCFEIYLGAHSNIRRWPTGILMRRRHAETLLAYLIVD